MKISKSWGAGSELVHHKGLLSELKRADFQFETKTEIKIEIQKRTQIGGKRGKIKMKDKYRFKLNFSWNHSQQCCAFHRRAAVKKVTGQLNVICIMEKFDSHNCKILFT